MGVGGSYGRTTPVYTLPVADDLLPKQRVPPKSTFRNPLASVGQPEPDRRSIRSDK